MVGAAIERREIFAVVEIVEIITILIHNIPARFELDPVFRRLRFGEVPQVVIPLHQFVEVFNCGQAAWGIKKTLSFVMSGNNKISFGQTRNLVVIGGSKKIEPRKREFRNAIGQEVERGIEFFAHVEFKGSKFGVCRYFHIDSKILRADVRGKNIATGLARNIASMR